MGFLRYLYLTIAGLVLVTGWGLITEKDRSLQLRRLPYVLRDTRSQMQAIGGYLRNYEKTHGRYPSNDEGLLVVKQLVQACRRSNARPDYRLSFCRIAPSGILTRFGDPFVYENRRGIGSAAFVDSPATLDRQRLYSVRADKGVFVYSVGAKQACETLVLWRPRLRWARLAVVLIAVGFVGLFVRDSVLSRSGQRAVVRLGDGIGATVAGLALAVLIPAFLFPVFARTCYEMRAYIPRRPKLTAEYKSLLAKYKQRGIIRDATYRKIIDAMAHDDRPF